jgi:hypothetical protein
VEEREIERKAWKVKGRMLKMEIKEGGWRGRRREVEKTKFRERQWRN